MGTKTEMPLTGATGAAINESKTVDENISAELRSASGISRSDRVVRVCDFTQTPGGRWRCDGPYSAAEFRSLWLRPDFVEAIERGGTVLVDLDGTAGYAAMFLDELFGGLVREFGRELVEKTVRVKSDAEPYLVEDIRQYIAEAAGKVVGV